MFSLVFSRTCITKTQHIKDLNSFDNAQRNTPRPLTNTVRCEEIKHYRTWPAVNDKWPLGKFIMRTYFPSEVEQSCSLFRHSPVWPSREVEMVHWPRLTLEVTEMSWNTQPGIVCIDPLILIYNMSYIDVVQTKCFVIVLIGKCQDYKYLQTQTNVSNVSLYFFQWPFHPLLSIQQIIFVSYKLQLLLGLILMV